MNSMQVVLPGSVKQDGTLELSQPVHLPPGPVEVTIKRVEQPAEDTWAVLERIWTGRKKRGARPRTVEEIDAQVNALRDEAEEEMGEARRTYEEGRRSKGQPPC